VMMSPPALSLKRRKGGDILVVPPAIQITCTACCSSNQATKAARVAWPGAKTSCRDERLAMHSLTASPQTRLDSFFTSAHRSGPQGRRSPWVPSRVDFAHSPKFTHVGPGTVRGPPIGAVQTDEEDSACTILVEHSLVGCTRAGVLQCRVTLQP